GDLQAKRGNGQGALGSYANARSIWERLAAMNPSVSDWQRGFALASMKIGDLLVAEHRNQEAMASYRSAEGILSGGSVAAESSGWLETLSLVKMKIGDVLRQERRTTDALRAYAAALPIREQLAAAHPENTKLQRELALCLGRTGLALPPERRAEALALLK